MMQIKYLIHVIQVIVQDIATVQQRINVFARMVIRKMQIMIVFLMNNMKNKIQIQLILTIKMKNKMKFQTTVYVMIKIVLLKLIIFIQLILKLVKVI